MTEFRVELLGGFRVTVAGRPVDRAAWHRRKPAALVKPHSGPPAAHGRLSEDIDLIAVGPRMEVARAIIRSIDHGLQRTHGRPRWRPDFNPNTDLDPALLEVGEDIAIKLHLLNGGHYSPWPTERRELEQRYSDAPAATLTAPTAEAFAGWKTAAWHDRNAPRDLYDLWALAGRNDHR